MASSAVGVTCPVDLEYATRIRNVAGRKGGPWPAVWGSENDWELAHMPALDYHVTIGFLGLSSEFSDDEIEEIGSALEGFITPFSTMIRATHIARFGPPDAPVVVALVEGASLSYLRWEMRNRVKPEFWRARSEYPFRPHITLAGVESDCPVALERDEPMDHCFGELGQPIFRWD